MTFRVIITGPAEADIRHAHEWWSADRSEIQVDRWYERIYDAIETLERMPTRCPQSREFLDHDEPIRQLLFGVGRRMTHRVVFAIRGDEVWVLRVRHVGQRDLTEDDLG